MKQKPPFETALSTDSENDDTSKGFHIPLMRRSDFSEDKQILSRYGMRKERRHTFSNYNLSFKHSGYPSIVATQKRFIRYGFQLLVSGGSRGGYEGGKRITRNEKITLADAWHLSLALSFSGSFLGMHKQPPYVKLRTILMLKNVLAKTTVSLSQERNHSSAPCSTES